MHNPESQNFKEQQKKTRHHSVVKINIEDGNGRKGVGSKQEEKTKGR